MENDGETYKAGLEGNEGFRGKEKSRLTRRESSRVILVGQVSVGFFADKLIDIGMYTPSSFF